MDWADFIPKVFVQWEVSCTVSSYWKSLTLNLYWFATLNLLDQKWSIHNSNGFVWTRKLEEEALVKNTFLIMATLTFTKKILFESASKYKHNFIWNWDLIALNIFNCLIFRKQISENMKSWFLSWIGWSMKLIIESFSNAPSFDVVGK